MKPQTSGASVANRMPVSAPASPKLAAKDLVLVGVLGAVAGAVCMGVQYSCQQTFVALGQARISLFLALLRKVILLIPLIYLLPRFLSDQVFAVLRLCHHGYRLFHAVSPYPISPGAGTDRERPFLSTRGPLKGPPPAGRRSASGASPFSQDKRSPGALLRPGGPFSFFPGQWAKGSLTVNVLPTPRVLSTATLPW